MGFRLRNGNTRSCGHLRQILRCRIWIQNKRRYLRQRAAIPERERGHVDELNAFYGTGRHVLDAELPKVSEDDGGIGARGALVLAGALSEGFVF